MQCHVGLSCKDRGVYCRHMRQCVAVCCSVVQYVAGVLQVCCSVMLGSLAKIEESIADICCSVLQCVAVCCSGVAGDSRPEVHLSSKTQF